MSGELGSVIDRLVDRGLRLVVAESCTGGLLAARLTDPPGASRYFLGGFIVYSNEAKRRLLGVPEDLLARAGAVSEEVCTAMARGARRATGAEAAVAITGVAGPTGGSEQKPVGTVWIAALAGEESTVRRYLFEGDRAEIRAASVDAALESLDRLLEGGAG